MEKVATAMGEAGNYGECRMTCPLQAPHFNQRLTPEQFRGWCERARSAACKGCKHFPGDAEKVSVEKVKPVQGRLF